MEANNSKHDQQIDEETAGLGMDEKRPNKMPKSEIEELAAEKGMGDWGEYRADQAGKTGPQPEGDATRNPADEAGRRGELLRKKADMERKEGDTSTSPQDWQKYDWA